MNSTLILFKGIGRQLLIVGLVLGSLPMAIRILWKLRLLPLGCYFVATKLFWPRWAAAHRTACILIFIACVLFFVLCWTIRYIRQKREEQIMAELIHHYTKDLGQDTGLVVHQDRKGTPLYLIHVCLLNLPGNW